MCNLALSSLCLELYLGTSLLPSGKWGWWFLLWWWKLYYCGSAAWQNLVHLTSNDITQNFVFPWKAGMHHIVLMVYTEIIFYHFSLRITFPMFLLRNNPSQIILSYPNSKTAKITACCIAQVTLIDFSSHTPLMTM